MAGNADAAGMDPLILTGSEGSAEVPRQATGRQWRVLVAMLVGITAMFSNIYATQPILPLLSRAFGVVPAVSGLTVSVVIFGMGTAALVYGPLSDRTGRKPVMLVTGTLLLLPTLGVVLAPTFSVLVLCRALQGLLIPGTTAVGLAYLQEVLPPDWRGFSTSAYVSATALGGLAGRLQGGFFADHAGWRWAFASFLVTTSLALIVMALWLPNRQVPRAPLNRAWFSELGHVYLALGTYLRVRRALGGALIGCTLFFAFISIFTYLPYRMEQPPFNFSQSAISLLYLVYLVGSFAVPWSGRLSDRVGRRAVIGGAMGMMLSGVLLTLLSDLVAVIVGLTLLNIGLLAAHAAASAFVTDNTSGGTGSASSFYLVWYYGGGMVGPTVAGLAWQFAAWPGVLAVCLLGIGLAFTSLVTLCAGRAGEEEGARNGDGGGATGLLG